VVLALILVPMLELVPLEVYIEIESRGYGHDYEYDYHCLVFLRDFEETAHCWCYPDSFFHKWDYC
jgi:hypothetical protein